MSNKNTKPTPAPAEAPAPAPAIEAVPALEMVDNTDAEAVEAPLATETNEVELPGGVIAVNYL